MPEQLKPRHDLEAGDGLLGDTVSGFLGIAGEKSVEEGLRPFYFFGRMCTGEEYQGPFFAQQFGGGGGTRNPQQVLVSGSRVTHVSYMSLPPRKSGSLVDWQKKDLGSFLLESTASPDYPWGREVGEDWVHLQGSVLYGAHGLQQSFSFAFGMLLLALICFITNRAFVDDL